MRRKGIAMRDMNEEEKAAWGKRLCEMMGNPFADVISAMGKPLIDMDMSGPFVGIVDEWQARIGKVLELRDIQGQPGNANAGPYMAGLYNGLELALATIMDRNPVYYEEGPEEKS